jgi:tripartite-type tricarboxylate transporter receptor subunit TctC
VSRPSTFRFALAILITAGAPALAAEPVSFKGKTVTMIIGFAAGGGTDLSGRLIASFLGKYLPGEPSVIAQNVPGAEGLTAMNYFAQQAKPDGLTLTMGSGSVADPMNFRKPQSQFDPTQFAYVGGAGRGGSMLIINKEAEKRLHDKSVSPVIMGSPGGAPRSGVQIAAWGMEFLGWNAKWVVGYRGTSDLMVALERGEIEMTATSNTQQIEKLLATGRFKVLVQSGALKQQQISPRSDFPDVPVMSALMQGKISDPLAAQSFDYWVTLHSEDKWLALPPGTPADIVRAYREAYAKVVIDAEFLARAKAMTDDFTPSPWQDLEFWMWKIGATPPAAIQFMSVMLRHQGIKPE